jgi:hypothetical protein
MRTRSLIALVLLLSCGIYGRDQQEWAAEAAPAVARVAQYQASLNGATALSTTQCVADRDRYVSDMRASVSRLEQMSSRIDGCFAMGYGSVMGMCIDMTTELQRYAKEGCSSEDPSQNRSDGLTHCSRMLARLDDAQTVVDSCD